MRVFVTRPIPEDGINLLKKRKSIKLDVYEKNEKISSRELLKRVKGVDAILSILTEKIDAEVMDAAGDQLKLIANYAVGFDNIDLEAAKKRDISVTNAPTDEISESVAEHTVALMLAIARRIVESDKYTRAGKYKSWGPKLMLGPDLRGKTIGIIGAGAIGSAVARILYRGFGCKILYHNKSKNPSIEKKYKAVYKSKMELLKHADFVTLHVPLLPSTKHLISTKELKAMKKTAYLINTSRGPVVNELALTKALERNQIAGASLDVFECEPLIDCNPEDTHTLRNLNNVILTPHTASATFATRQSMSRQAALNILALASNKKLPNKIV